MITEAEFDILGKKVLRTGCFASSAGDQRVHRFEQYQQDTTMGRLTVRDGRKLQIGLNARTNIF